MMNTSETYEEISVFDDLKILVLDDDSQGVSSILSTIKELYPGSAPIHATSVRDTIHHLNTGYWDVVVLDLNMDRDNDFRDRSDKSSAGFYAYLHLHGKLSTYTHQLPPLVLLYTGHPEIYRYLQPFMDSKWDAPFPGVELSRPFAIVDKRGEILKKFETFLSVQEKERFRSYIRQFRLHHNFFRLIEELIDGFDYEGARELGNENLYGGLNLRNILPTLYARILKTAGGTLPELTELLEGYDKLSLLNMQFFRNTPGSKLLHYKHEQTEANWRELSEGLKKLPEDLAAGVIEDLFGGANVPDDISSTPPWKVLPDFPDVAEKFKAKWSRWEERVSPDTMTTYIMDEVQDLLGEKNYDDIQLRSLTSNVYSQSRLYVEPNLMAEVARVVVTNAIENAWKDFEGTRAIWIVPSDDQTGGTFSLDIADNGKGFAPVIAWQSPFNSFYNLNRMLSGWATPEVYTTFEGKVFRITPDKYEGEECGNWPLESTLLGELGSIGTIVRIAFNKRSGWEYQG